MPDLSSVAAAEAVLEGLTEPGRRLVFCDDTDIAGQPYPWLKPDLRILVAVEIGSEAYAEAAQQMEARLSILGMPKFHATEIANPPTKSSWKSLPPEVRIDALRFLAELVTSSGARVYEAHVPKAQFAALKAKAQLVGKVGVGFKQGLKRVFLRCLFDHLATSEEPVILVVDQEKGLTKPVVEDWPEAAFLVGGGPVAARSLDVPGLQLADMAAWSVNRMLCRRPGFDDDSATEMDQAALEVVGNLEDGLGNLLAMSAALEAQSG